MLKEVFEEVYKIECCKSISYSDVNLSDKLSDSRRVLQHIVSLSFL